MEFINIFVKGNFAENTDFSSIFMDVCEFKNPGGQSEEC